MYYQKYIDGFTDKEKPDKSYYQNLSLFYNFDSVCPKCKGQIIKKKDRNIINMKCKNCHWAITIDMAKYVNLYNIVYKNKERNNNIIHELTEAVKMNKILDLDGLKFLNIDEIDKIFDDQRKEKIKQIDDEYELFHKIYLLNKERKKWFSIITESINKKNRKKLVEGFKSGSTIEKLIKDTGLNKFTVEGWIKWLKTVEEYIKVTQKLKISIDKKRQMKENMINLNTHFLVKAGKIKESKEIKNL